jgi:allantoin racemase
MRLLIINPNTSAAMTDKVAAKASSMLPPGTEIIAATGRFGPRYIASRASFAVAGHAALDAFAEHGRGCNAVLLACFGDPGLDAIRELAPMPVISLIDASCAEAGAGGRRFSIVTGGERWGPMLTEMLAQRGLSAQLASIKTVAPTGGDIARDPEGSAALLAQACRQCAEEDGAGAVILGGAGLIGIASLIQPGLASDIICSNEAGLRAAARALATSQRQPEAATGQVEAIGLSAALTKMFQQGHLPG